MALILFPLTVSAQEASELGGQLNAAVQRLEIGQQVRLDTDPGGRVEGTVIDVGVSELLLGQQAEVTRVRLPEVERLWVRGRAAKTGAIVGALAGAIGGLAFGLLIGEVACAETDCTRGEVAAVTGLLGVAGGGFVGGVVGVAVPKWHLRFP